MALSNCWRSRVLRGHAQRCLAHAGVVAHRPASCARPANRPGRAAARVAEHVAVRTTAPSSSSRASGTPLVVVLAGPLHAAGARDRGGTGRRRPRRWRPGRGCSSADRPAGTHTWRRRGASRAVPLGRGRGPRHLGAHLDEGGGEHRLAATTAGGSHCALHLGAELGDRQGPHDEGGQDGHAGGGGAHLFEQQAQPRGSRDRSRRGPRARRCRGGWPWPAPPTCAGRAPRPRLELLEPLVGRLAREDLAGQVAHGLLFLGEGEVHLLLLGG